MVVDGVMQIRVPQVRAASNFAGSPRLAVGTGVAGALGAAVYAMSTSVGDSPELFDVDVDLAVINRGIYTGIER